MTSNDLEYISCSHIPFTITDSHCHLQKVLVHDKDICNKLKTTKICLLDVGIDPTDWKKRIEVFSNISEIYFSIGLHPSLYNFYTIESAFSLIEKHASKATAIGESGLDWYQMYAPRNTQLEFLELQIAISKTHKKPIIFHARDYVTEQHCGKSPNNKNCNTNEMNSIDDILHVLAYMNHTEGGIMHCFSGTYEQAKKCIDLGFYISFSSNIISKNTPILQHSAKNIPSDFLLLETDSPFLLHKTIRKLLKKNKKENTYNSPLYIPYLYNTLSKIKNITMESLADILYTNLKKALRI